MPPKSMSVVAHIFLFSLKSDSMYIIIQYGDVRW